MGRVEGKVAFITGAARGQGRAHAVQLAQEGADIIALDICDKIETSIAAPSTEEDLAETVRLVEEQDRRIIARKADVRDFDALKAVVDEGVAEFGRIDIVAANAGMWSYNLVEETTEVQWQEIIDICLTGVWHTVKAAIPPMKAAGNGGSIIITSSAAGLKAYPNCGAYVAAKHGLVGLMRTLAVELAPFSIRANSLHPTNVDTALIRNQMTYDLFSGGAIENPAYEDVYEGFKLMNALPVACLPPSAIADALLFLASDESKYITGVTLPVDAGLIVK
ncbi:MAG TPA: mycofactocin-coupled SDR family oxidoreductase [Trebonia sp.]|jgi:SDR family mycofactocin-dependent oxidoreductase|nr:mycofactocin-coupled SDR family oxidoreductase [Trebonia sp.]